MLSLKISLQRKYDEFWPVVAEMESPGVLLPVRKEGKLDLALEDLNKAADPWAYGEVLGRALFKEGEILDAWSDALGEARRQPAEEQRRLRVLLYVEDETLRHLHWERLTARLEGEWIPLGIYHGTPFSQYLPSRIDRRFPPLRSSDLSLLAMVASPLDLASYQLQPFNAPDALQSVQRALGQVPCDWLGSGEAAAGPASLDALCEQLVKKRYALLHLVCHGRYNSQSGETVLYLADAAGKTAPVEGQEFIRRLRLVGAAHPLPYFIFLSSCESADPQAENGLGGLGQRLVRDLGIPAVLAMTSRVSLATAQALAQPFYAGLVAHGELDRALTEATTGLVNRGDVSVPALFSRLGAQPLFSETAELELAASQLQRGVERLRSQLEIWHVEEHKAQFEQQAEVLLKMGPLPEAALSAEQKLQRKTARETLNRISLDVLDVPFEHLALDRALPAFVEVCPFRGLFPFREEDYKFFFGREPLVHQLAQRLHEHPFLAVLGASGSGKSSLVFAGLVPTLKKDEPNLVVVHFTPGANPLRRLQEARERLEKETGPSGANLLAVDQFEELFTLCESPSERRSFIEALLGMADTARVVLTLRADFWGECAPYEDLKAALLQHQELVAPMNASELRSAMEQQAASVGLEFEVGLSADILEDVRGEPGAMPLLQQALLLLWRGRRGHWLRAEDYQAFGGVAQAIAHTAEQVFTRYPEQQERLRQVFVRLTRLDEEVGLGGERRDTRRRIPLADLVSDPAELSTMRDLVQILAGERLVVTSLDPESASEQVEVAHEALIRSWPRLVGWLEEDRQALLLRDRLHREAQEWSQHGEEESYLALRGRRLQDSETLLSHPRLRLSPLEQRYLQACQVAAQSARLWRMDVHYRITAVPSDVARHYRTGYFGGKDIPDRRDTAWTEEVETPLVEMALTLPGAPPRFPTGSVLTDQILDPVQAEAYDQNAGGYAEFLLSGQVFKEISRALEEFVGEAPPESPVRLLVTIDSQAAHLRRIPWQWAGLRELVGPQGRNCPLWTALQVNASELPPRSLRAQLWQGLACQPGEAPQSQHLQVQHTRWQALLAAPLVKPSGAGWLDGSTGWQDLVAAFWNSGNVLYLLLPADADFVDGLSGELARHTPPPGQANPPLLLVLDLCLPEEVQMQPGGQQPQVSRPQRLRQSLYTLAEKLAGMGVPALLALPPGLPDVILPAYLGRLAEELEAHAQVDRAVHSAGQLAAGIAPAWGALLYLAVDDSRLWYKPGFGLTRPQFEVWPAIIRATRKANSTLLLGPALSEPLWGPPEEIAASLAAKHGLSEIFERDLSLPAVLQELSVQLYTRASYDEYLETLIEKLSQRHGERLRASLDLEQIRSMKPDESLKGLLQAAWRADRLDHRLEAYQLLAELPVSVILNTNPDRLLLEALQAAGKVPEVIVSPWNEYAERLSTVYDREPNFQSTPQRPLVLYFYGRLDEPTTLALTRDDHLDIMMGLVRNRELLPKDLLASLVDSALVFVGFRPESSQFQSLIRFLFGFASSGGGMLRQRYPHLIQLEPAAGTNLQVYRQRQEQYFSKSADLRIYWGSVADFTEDFRQHWESGLADTG